MIDDIQPAATILLCREQAGLFGGRYTRIGLEQFREMIDNFKKEKTPMPVEAHPRKPGEIPLAYGWLNDLMIHNRELWAEVDIVRSFPPEYVHIAYEQEGHDRVTGKAFGARLVAVHLDRPPWY